MIKWLNIVIAALLIAAPPAKAAALEDEERPGSPDRLSLEQGAVLLDFTSEYGSRSDAEWTALALIDGNPERGWASAEGAAFPHEFLFELADDTAVVEIGFDTRHTEEAGYPGIAARKIRMLASTEARDRGYREVWQGTLDEPGLHRFEIDRTPARWLRIVIEQNGGRTDYTELMEVSAFGEIIGESALQRADRATYETNWNTFYIIREGRELRGCYDFDGGRFSGYRNDHLINIEWRENAGAQTGKAVMAMTRDGGAFSGFWYENGRLQGTWLGKRTEAAAPDCADSLKDETAGSAVKRSLDQTGRAALYGIYFDHDSATLRAESEPVLTALKDWLAENPGKAIVIEGHTDSTGDREYNLDLSRQRAQAVMAWLTERDIAADRLSAIGRGESQPVADNAGAQGRALNRRVEVRLAGTD